MRWKIEHNYASGWGDAGWTTDGKPDRFPTKRAAEAAINEFIRDTRHTSAGCFLADEYRRRDYRAVQEEE